MLSIFSRRGSIRAHGVRTLSMLAILATFVVAGAVTAARAEPVPH